MEDTNKINVNNIKAVVGKIKTWVIERLPIRYTNNNLSIYDTKARTNKVAESDSMGTTVDTKLWGNKVNVEGNVIEANVNNITIDATKSNFTQNSSKVNIYGKESTKLVSGSSNNITFDSSNSDGNIDMKSITNITYETNDTSLTFEDGGLSLVDNANNRASFISGHQISDITDWKYGGVYAGHTDYIGRIYGITDTGTLNSGTAFSGWSSSDTGLYTIHNLTHGTWVLCYSFGHITATGSRTTGAPDGKRVCGAWFVTSKNGTAVKEILPESRNTVISGADGHILCAQGTAIVHVPYGEKWDLTVMGWQNAGAVKDMKIATNVVRIS